MKRRSFITTLFSLPFISRFSFAESALDTVVKQAFSPGEKLTYSLGWQFIVAGHATVEVLPDEEIDGRMVRNFRLKARTAKAVDPIYKVRDTLTSTTDYDATRSLGYQKKQHEGDDLKDETIEFDWEKMEARYHEAISGKRDSTPILENTLDPLSAFYFVRNQPFEVGTSISGPLTDGKKCKIAEIKIVKREKIKVNGTEYDTFKLIPDVKDIGGVFKKSKDAKLAIWCTADYRHIPVLMKSKVTVGSFQAELESIETA